MSSPGAKTREAVPRKVRSRSTVLTSPGSPRRIRTSPGVLLDEIARPRGGFQLTAGENLSSPAVLAGLGSVLNDKYAEGYPGHRYYRGCEEAGRAEEIAVERAKRLFGSIMPTCSPTAAPRPSWRRTRPFRSRATRSRRSPWSTAAASPTGPRPVSPADGSTSSPTACGGTPRRSTTTRCGTWRCATVPRVIVCGATAYSRLIDCVRRGAAPRVPRLRPEFRAYAAAAADNARTLVEGPAAEGLRPVSGGTDTHLALVDLRGAE